MSLLPSLNRLSLHSIPTGSVPDDPLSVAIVLSLTNGSDADKVATLLQLQDHVRGDYRHARNFVDANGIVAMVGLLLTSPVSIKVLVVTVLNTLLSTGTLIHDRFVASGGVQAVVRTLSLETATSREVWEQTLVPLLELVDKLSILSSGRARLKTQNAIEVLCSVVREVGLEDTYDHEGVQALMCILKLVFDIGRLEAFDEYATYINILVVDGSQAQQWAMEALENLTRPEGAHTVALRRVLVDQGALPVLLRAIGPDIIDDRRQLPRVKHVASTALQRLTDGNAGWLSIVGELRVVLRQVLSLNAQLEAENWAGLHPLRTEALDLAANHPQWFILLGGMDAIVAFLTNANSQATVQETMDMLLELYACLAVVNWTRDFVNEAPYPHPYGENAAAYNALVPVLMHMLHDGVSVRRTRQAARCLERLSGSNVAQSMRTEAVIGSLLAFLNSTLPDEEVVQSVLSILSNDVIAYNDTATTILRNQGGLSVVVKYLASTSEITLAHTAFLVRRALESEPFELDDDMQTDEEQEERAQKSYANEINLLVALLRPGRLAVVATRYEVVLSLKALLVPPLTASQIPASRLVALIASFDAFVAAGGIELLVPLLRMNIGDTDDDTHMNACKLLLGTMDGLLFDDTRSFQTKVRFAVAGGVAALVDAGKWQEGNTNSDYVTRMREYLPWLLTLDQALYRNGPSWVKMLLDVTYAVALGGMNQQDELAGDCHEAFPEKRWGRLNRLKIGIRSYGQIYDLLSKYRAILASLPNAEGVLYNCPVFEWMDMPEVLLKAALSRVTSIQNGKEVMIVNHKPSLLAAELWIVKALSEVLTTNVSVPVASDNLLTEAQNEQSEQYLDLLGDAQRLALQYGWAAARKGAPAHFVETHRTELRINQLLEMLVEKLEKPTHVDGNQTVMHRADLESLVHEGLMEDNKRVRTNATLRASVTTLYGAMQTDATMARLFPHLC
tara:strand:+ start:336 stop:3218 length:2883 start_codon:yes stop_codon:yes gene_type:complete